MWFSVHILEGPEKAKILVFEKLADAEATCGV